MNDTNTMATSVEPATQKSRPPIGMILLCLYLIYSIYTELSTIGSAVMIFGPIAFEGLVPTAYRLIAAAADATVLFAIIKRKSWTLKVALSWFGFLTLQAIVHFILSDLYKAQLPALYSRMSKVQNAFPDEFSVTLALFFVFVLTAIVQGTILWYLYSRRSYFNLQQSGNVASIDLHQFARLEPVLVKRALAAFLDYALFMGIVSILFYFGYVSFLFVLVFWFVYFVAIESILGYTLFKGLFDLRIVRDNRNDFPLMVALKRHLCDPLDFFLFGGVAILVSKLRPDHKRLGDLFAHSTVQMEK